MALKRVLVVWLPAFRLERCGFVADEPAGLIHEIKGAMRLISLTPMAREGGLRVGMSASEARALMPSVSLIEHRPHEEAADQAALARAFGALSDQVRFTWDSGLELQVGSVSHLFGGEEGIAQRAIDLAQSLGHCARAVVASDPRAAMAVALGAIANGETAVVPVGTQREVLRPLPLECLLPASEMPDFIVAMQAIGIATIGQFGDLDAASVVGRYPRAIELHRVARGVRRARTHLHEPIPSEFPQVSAALAGATTVAELQFLLPGMVHDLCGQLHSRDSAVVRLKMVLNLESEKLHSETIRVGRPTRAPATLERLIRGRLERLSLDAPVEGWLLEAFELSPDTGWQPGLTDRSEATEPLPDLVARLADQLGTDALITAELTNEWAPERAWVEMRTYGASLRCNLLGSLASPEERLSVRLSSDDPVEVQEAYEDSRPGPRPLLLIPRPARIDVVTNPRGVPQQVKLEERTFQLDRAQGPERLTGAWWEPTHQFDRSYWVVEFQGRSGWVFQESESWFFHGWFD